MLLLKIRIAHSHFAGLLNLPQCYRYAICDPCEDGRAEKLKEQYGVEKACADYKELLGDPKVDAVIVTTPDHTHCEIASAFLRDGKPVLLEKPMALKKEDCDELLKVSKETGTMLYRLIMIGFKLLLLPVVVSVTYEINRWIGRHDNGFTRVLAAPGMWMQNFTTNEPDDSMIEVGIAAVQAVLPAEEGSDRW